MPQKEVDMGEYDIETRDADFAYLISLRLESLESELVSFSNALDGIDWKALNAVLLQIGRYYWMTLMEGMRIAAASFGSVLGEISPKSEETDLSGAQK